jgi:hypothetical protein
MEALFRICFTCVIYILKPMQEKNPHLSQESNLLTQMDLPKNPVTHLRESLGQDDIEKQEGWSLFEKELLLLGLHKKDALQYLSNVSKMHGGEVIVRRANIEHVLSSLKEEKPLSIIRLDSEPNAAILGKEYKEGNDSRISGVEAAMEGGFSSLVEGKVAGVFGFTTEHSHLTVSLLDKSSPSLMKKHGETMRGVEGSLMPEDVLFILFRIHKSVYPEALCVEEDFDEMTGELNPFILRLYAKNRQTH